MRSTSIFRAAHSGVCPFPLCIWEPPYWPHAKADDVVYDAPLLNTRHAMNGYQLRLLEDAGHKRYEQFSSEANPRLAKSMEREVEARLMEWTAGYEQFAYFEGSDWDIMVRDLAVEWGAKVLYCLRDEARLRRSGYDKYLTAYKDQTLKWQCIKVVD
jgi:hypothetical protein